MNSYHCEACEGCKHITNRTDEFCYMFKKAPEVLPCGQHDKYELQRRITGELIRKNPAYLIGMIMEIEGRNS